MIWHFKQMLLLENQIYAPVGVFFLALALHQIWSLSLLKPALIVALTSERKGFSVPRALKRSSIYPDSPSSGQDQCSSVSLC